jgi:hypothetical protein
VELHLFWTVVHEASSAAAILISHLQNSSHTKERPYYMFRVRYLLAACLLLSRRELLCNQFTKHNKSMQKSGDNHHHAYSSFLFPKRLQKPMEAFLIIIKEGVPFNCIGPPAHSRQLSPIMLRSPKTSIRRRRLSS